jgi:hypothetical protein
MYGKGVINAPQVDTLDSTVFAPVSLYCGSELPGSELLSDTGEWCEFMGGSSISFDVDIDWVPELGVSGDDSPETIPD